MNREIQEIEEEDFFAKAEKAVDDLYIIRDTYFPANPLEKCSKLHYDANLAFELISSIPPVKRTEQLEKAKYEYLTGKVFDVFPIYLLDAQDHLVEALKLNPNLGDAWLSLGNCLWKNGELSEAKKSFKFGLNKGQDKKILREMSMLDRRMAVGSANKAKIVEESIQRALKAVSLDLYDGISWYNLGNAFLTSFVSTGAWEHGKLHQSLNAYINAEMDEKIKSKRELHFNRAMVNKFLEDYEKALIGFEEVASKYVYQGGELSGLNSVEEAQKILVLLDKLVNLRQKTMPIQIPQVSSSLATVNANLPHKRRTINHLEEGVNKDVAVVGKVLFYVQDSFAPLYYIICDESGVCHVLTVYGILVDTIKSGDQVTVLDPYYRLIDFSWKEKTYKFKSIRVNLLEQVVLNGRTLLFDRAYRAEVNVPYQV